MRFALLDETRLTLNISWSPAHEVQAYARTHRLGQRKDVLISRLVVARTVERRSAYTPFGIDLS